MDLNNLGTLNQGGQTTAAPANSASATPNASTDQRFSVSGPIAAADSVVYHGSATPISPTLLTQRGVGAYLQLLNALAGDELHEKSTDLLTSSLRSASATLRS